MKYTLHTLPVNGGAFNCRPAQSFDIDDDRIATTSSDGGIEFTWERPASFLWVIGNEYGALGAVWARCEQDAFDELVDRDWGAGLLIDEADADEDSARLGNAGEAANLDNAWIAKVGFDLVRDRDLVIKLAEARGANVNLLSEV